MYVFLNINIILQNKELPFILIFAFGVFQIRHLDSGSPVFEQNLN